MPDNKCASHTNSNNTEEITVLLDHLSKQLPPAFGRSSIDQFFPGIISSKSQANIDSAGKGPPAFRYGRLVFYNRDSYLEWLRKRIKSIKHC